jgi:hypothetical protein
MYPLYHEWLCVTSLVSRPWATFCVALHTLLLDHSVEPQEIRNIGMIMFCEDNTGTTRSYDRASSFLLPSPSHPSLHRLPTMGLLTIIRKNRRKAKEMRILFL